MPSSSSSPSSGGPQIQGMEEFQHLHIRSPPPHPFKASEKHRHRQRHHGSRSPPPPHHRHHGGHSPLPPHHLHFAHKHRHHSAPPPPICTLHCKKDKLRVKPSKHCKKVQKLHSKLMKAPKGAYHHMHNVCPGARKLGFPTDVPRPACCLHYHGLSTVHGFEMLAGLEQRPPCRVAGIGHHGHRAHRHFHGRHGPRVRSAIRHGSAPPMSPSRDAKAMPPEHPGVEAAVPLPASGNMLLAREDGPAET